MGIEPTHKGFADPFLSRLSLSASTLNPKLEPFCPLFVRFSAGPGRNDVRNEGKVIRSLVYRPATTASWYLGQLPILCFAEGMTSYLYAHKIWIFDYPVLLAVPESTTGKRGATGSRKRHPDSHFA